jgi:error-prone DNA polymerase
MTAGGEVVEDYHQVGLSLKTHPLRFLREDLVREEIITCAEATAVLDDKWVEAAGIVLVHQRPGAAVGVIFMTIEDETGTAHLVVWPDVFEKYGQVILSARMLGFFGRVQKEGDVVNIVARRLTNWSRLLADVGNRAGASLGGDRTRQRSVLSPCEADHALRNRYSLDGSDDSIKVKTRDFR